MKGKIYVSNSEFGAFSPTYKDRLMQSGLDINFNETKRKLTAKDLISLAFDADGLIAGTEELETLINKSNRLKIISKIGVGLDNIPLKLCKEKNITVCYTADAVTNAAAEHTIALIFSLIRKVCQANELIRSGNWQRLLGKEINELNIGIIGFGRIGKRLAEFLMVFKPKTIFICDPLDKGEVLKGFEGKIKQVELNYLLANSDLISVHADLNESSKNLINDKNSDLIKSGTYIINAARGGIINEATLIKLLDADKISVALDVYSNEPYSGQLLNYKNSVFTCHMGSLSYKARLAMEDLASQAVIDFFNGITPKNIVPKSEYKYL